MTDISQLINQYVKSELLILIPVLYILAKVLSNANVCKKNLALILLAISIFLSAIYTFATSTIPDWQGILLATFTSIVQGTLVGGSAIVGNSMIQLTKTKKNNDNSSTDDCNSNNPPPN